jgi:hypothetical protein
VEYGEKCTTFFLNLQYRNTNKNNLQKLVTEESMILQMEFYKEFFPNNIKNRKLTNVQKDQITEEEQRKNFLMLLNPFSLENPQGLMAYRVRYIKPSLNTKSAIVCFNYSYRNGGLSGTQREGLISLLLKQDLDGKYKDPVYLKNWRALTRQCTSEMHSIQNKKIKNTLEASTVEEKSVVPIYSTSGCN